MARRSRVRSSFVVYDFDDIHPEDLWKPGHEIYDWCVFISKELETNTKATAPGGAGGRSESRWGHRGTGRLNAGIHAFGKRTGEQSYEIVLNSDAPYTQFVHGGTAFARGGFIYSDWGWANKDFIDANIGSWSEGDWHSGTGKGENAFHILPVSGRMFMVLPPGPGGTRRFHLRVRGQKANAFLVRGWNRTALFHESLEPFQFVEPVGY